MESQLLPSRTVATRTEPPEVRAIAANIAAEWPLVGRAQEFDRVWKTLNETQHADVVLSGVAGVGKSRLAREIAARARASGWALEWIRATEATRNINFGAVARWAEPSSAGPMRSRERLAQLGEYLLSRARAQRVLLTVDDAHFLDTGTASLIQQYATGDNIRVVLTVGRESVASDAVRAVWSSPHSRRMEVQSLSLDQIDELLSTALGGRIDRPSRAALWRLCVGNVLLLRELVVGGLASGELISIDGVWHWWAETPLTASVRELIRSRTATLSSTERATLETVALGEPLPEALVVGTPYEQDVVALERAGLVRWAPEASEHLLRMAHPLFAEAVRELTPTLAAHRARRSLAAAILSAPIPSPRRELRAAVWLLDAGAIPDVHLLLAAAHYAGRLSAPRLQERIARAGREAYGGYTFSLLLAHALVMQGKWDEPAKLCTSPPLSEADTHERQCEVAALRAEALAFGFDRLTDALGLLQHATLGYDGPASGHCVALRGAIAMFCSDLNQAVSASEQVLATRDATHELTIRGLICAIPALTLMGRTTAALASAAHGQALLDAGVVAPAIWRADLVYSHISALRFGGRYVDALQMAGRFYETLEDAPPTASALAAFALGQILLDVGRLASAEVALREALALFRDADLTGTLPWCLYSLAHTVALTHHDDGALELLGLPDGVMSVAPIFRPEIARARAWVVAASGELSAGANLAREAAAQAMQLGQFAVAARSWHDLALLGEPGPAAVELADLARTTESDEPALFRDHAEALAAENPVALDGVYERFHRSGAILWAAEASAVASTLYLAAGHRAPAERARQRVAQCVAACEGVTTPALRRILGTDPMSRRESEVATLAAHGLTNTAIADRLNVSVRTVEGHLQQVYAKLEIHRRRDLPG